MKKLGLSLLFALMLVGMFAAQASATTPTPPTTQTVVAPNPSNTDASGNKLLNVDASQNRDDFDPINIAGQNPNANRTLDGVNDQTGASSSKVIKSDGMRDNKGVTKDHATHGSYQNNTNSCASCHQTHTAKARQLLFADSTYNTCTACHDGTLGFYNVFKTGANYTSSTNESTGGTFGGSHDGNMSVHLANGAVKIAAAPGGSKVTSDSNSWGATFTCASCHAPHGSYSQRLLHYNPANMGNMPAEKGGNQFTANIVNYADTLAPTAASPKQIAVRGTKAEHGLTTGYESIPANGVVVMIYDLKSTTVGTTTTYSYTKNTNPWLYGYTSTSKGRNYYSRLFATDQTAIANLLNSDGTIKGYDTTGMSQSAQNTYNWTNPIVDQNDYQNHQQPGNPVAFKYNKGLVYAETTDGDALLNSMTSIQVGRAYVVGLNLMAAPDATLAAKGITKHDVSSLWGTSSVTGTSNTAGGVQVSTWCTTCHTDYLFASSWNGAVSKNGNYEGTKYYGHTTNSGSYTCLRCHFAHGTDVTVMVDGNSQTIEDLQKPVLDGGKAWTEEVAKDYMLDRNPSSALKKFTNLSGCWACHNSSKASTLKNTNRDEEHPDGAVSDLSQR